MAVANYRGFSLKTSADDDNTWQVQIRNHSLSGNLVAVKKSIDWFCDTARIIDPKEFSTLTRKLEETPTVAHEHFNGYLLQNDNGESNGWYCFFNGRLIKGSKLAIQKHIEAYLSARQRAEQQIKK
ncbi:DUF3319 domain-containing protein [Vibrio sp.]|uniref:DUF3319 domain-containing protein n=1 Tax=Vibrio sp. TaxID=678 RepID=UPI003D0ED5C1